MSFVKYTLACVIGCLDTLVGKKFSGGITEGIVGCVSILVCGLSIFGFWHVLQEKTSYNWKLNIFLAISLTVFAVLIVFGVAITLEKIFKQ